jgi:hypothetical protein
MGKNKTKTMKARSKRSKSRRRRSSSRKRVAGSTNVEKGCAGVEKGIRIDQKRIDLSDWDPYRPGTGIYRGEVDCGNKEVTGKGRASGNGTWESDNILHGSEETFMKSNAKKSGTVVTGKWENNMPAHVTVTTSNGTFNYHKETHEMTQQHIRDSMSSRGSMLSDRDSASSRGSMLSDRDSASSRGSMLSDRSSRSSLDSEYDFTDRIGSRGSNVVRGSWLAKKTTGGRRRKNRKTRRHKRKN